MIENIQIRNLGVIEDAELVFGNGLTVLTGETGAGKTMVLTALGLLLGERSDSSAIRAGESQTNVTGVWNLPAAHEALSKAEDAGALIENGELILSRTVSNDGRSKASAGGRQVPVGVLNELGQLLVVVHGQSDQLRLKSANAQRQALDEFAGDDHAKLLSEYQTAYSNFKTAQKRLEDARSGTLKLEAEKAELTDAIEFLSRLNPKPNEDVELQDLAQRLTHTEQLRTAVSLAHGLLSSEDFDAQDAISKIGQSRKALESVAVYDAELGEIAEKLRFLGVELGDVAISLANYLESNANEAEMSLDQVQQRRSEINQAIRRFGPTLDDVFRFEKDAVQRLAELEAGTESIDTLEANLQAATEIAFDLAKKISGSRSTKAKELSERVAQELTSLAMPNAQLVVAVKQTEELGPQGLDQVEFLMSSYPGAEPRPIAKSASGGELSRIMLALEVVLAENGGAQTFIFDEVDAGVGGSAAIEVGRRLAKLARKSQVVVVTHLAQVAAFADQHLVVVKNESGSFTASAVRNLDASERLVELARMLSGLEQSDTAKQHAQELLDLAKSS